MSAGRRQVVVAVLVDPVEHVLPVGGQRQLQQQPGEAAARFDDAISVRLVTSSRLSVRLQ